ncbi:MAG: hypothetical protein ACM3XM_11770 [Mycobacterium leprae]
MKRIVSISLGSSKRNHSATVEILGEQVTVERIGTDGSFDRAIAMIKELDGQVDAFGMGGTDLYLYAGGRRYTFRDSQRLARAAVKTPIADGSGLKNTLERRVVRYVDKEILPLKGRKVLLTSALDRFGMAEAVAEAGADVIYGDLMFALGINIPLRSLKTVSRLARLLLPVITKLPFTWLYPTGAKQEQREVKYEERYQWADLICGDWLYIGRHMPDRLAGKTILTNTVTPADIEELKKRGVATLITTTPNLGGRSFGTNLMEALIVATAKKKPEEMQPAEYEAWLDRIGFVPRVERLNSSGAAAD